MSIADMTDDEFMAWLKPHLPPVDPEELVARIRASKAEALQSPFQNVWLAGGQIPSCEALGHRVYNWSHNEWQVFQHGDNEEARFVSLWHGKSVVEYGEEAYLEDWEGIMERIRLWVDEVHAWEAR